MSLKIGEVAKQTGVTVGTLRYYERLKLISPVFRGTNGYRYYNQAAIETVKFIKQAQTIGFSLQEIRSIIEVRSQGKLPCSMVKTLLDEKIWQISLQIQELNDFKAKLSEYREIWANKSPANLDKSICPLITTVEPAVKTKK